MNKKELRQIYKIKRHNLIVEQIDKMSLAIANNILKIDVWDKLYFHLFLSIQEQKEVNTEYILHLLQGKDKEIVISKADFETLKMTHFLLTDNTKIKKNEYDIPEPVDGLEVPTHKIDVVFVPLLTFDTIGNRIGYGKGFYDRFLSECKPEAIKVGLSFFEVEKEVIAFSKNDIKLNYCVTPKQIYQF